MPEALRVDAVIALIEANRSSLGHAEVDFAVRALRERLETPAPFATAPKLRQVSVLFIDIVDSTAMLQRRSAEDALEVVGAALQRFAALVQEADGKVLRFTGDGLKVVFGGDQAREDDAERAVRCGLALLAAAAAHAAHLHQSFGIAGFAVRVGIHTGPVVLGGGVEADNTAMGHAVHIAARLEQSAPAGRLRISHGTWALVRGLFDVEAQPPLPIKGSDEPLLTYFVRGAVPRGERMHQRGLQGVVAPMLGRDAELAALQALVAQAAALGRAQAATVLADAGVGKSRLLRELQHSLQTGKQPVLALLARAQPTQQLQPYGLLRDLLARRLQIADDEGADSARAKLVAGLAPLFPGRGVLPVHLIGILIGIDFPDSPVQQLPGRERRERSFKALRQALHAWASAAAPLLLMLDDVHWADDGSLDFLQQLVAGADPAPLAMVMLARPLLLERRPRWLEGEAAHRRLPLAPLSAAQSGALATALLQRVADLPPALHAMLVTRAAGNPYFMEELLRMLIDDGAIATAGERWQLRPERLAQVRLPETLVGVLQARLDTLPAEELRALQQASIVGSVFWEDALAALDTQATAALPALHTRAMVQAREGSAFAHTREHAFHHPLLHEVTYGTVLKAVRREGHARAAHWLAERVADRAGEFLAVTAQHFEAANDSERALYFYDRAAQDASQRFAHSAALAVIERALAQPALRDPAWRFHLHFLRFQAAEHQSDNALAALALDALSACAETADNDGLRARALAARMLYADHQGDGASAAALAHQAVSLAESCGCAPAAALAHGELAWLAVSAGRPAQAQSHLEAGLPWARRACALPTRDGGDPQFEIKLSIIGIDCMAMQERLVDAERAVQAAFALTGDMPSMNRFSLLNHAGWIASLLGDLDTAQARYSEGLAVAREIELPRCAAAVLCGLAEVAEFRGDLAAALTHAREAVRVARAGDVVALLPSVLDAAATVLCALRQFDVALQRWGEALALFTAQERPVEACALRARRAALHRARGDAGAAHRDLNEALALPDALASLPATALACAWRAAKANADPRAATLLRALRTRLDNLLSQVPSSDGRERIVEQLPHWRAVTEAAPVLDTAP